MNHLTQGLEEQLRSLKERLNRSQRIARIGDVEFDVESGSIYWSDYAYELFGRDKQLGPPGYEEVMAQYEPEDAAQLEACVRKAVETGEPYALDLRIRRETDDMSYHHAIGAPVREGGKTVRISGTVQDVTDRKRIELSLARSKERFRTLIEFAPMSVYETDATGSCVYVNHAWREQAGLSLEDALGDGWVAGVHPDDRERIAALWNLHANSGEPWRLEYRFRTPDGNTTWVLGTATALRGPEGEITGYLGANVDITARKEYEAQLREISTRQFEAVHAANVGLWAWDLATDEIEVSAEYQSQLGYETQQQTIRAEEWTDRIHPDDRSRVADEIARCTEEHLEEQTTEYRVRHRDGTYRWILSRASTLVDDQGKPTCLRGSQLDITEQKRVEIALLRKQRAITLSNEIAAIFLTEERDAQFPAVMQTVREVLSSEFGYFGYIDESGDLVCMSMTHEIWDKCRMAEKTIRFPRANWGGLWGRSLIEKRTIMSNDQLDPPQGHLPLSCALAVPILLRDELIGQFVVANKEGGYDTDDCELLEQTAAQTAPLLDALLEAQKRAREHDRLAGQYQQAQKMEAVGQLTGGVAHDFNNLLQVVNGFTEMARSELEPGHPAEDSLEQVARAGERARQLVSQLLLFSRRQIMQPQMIELNDVVSDLMGMLTRLVGEHIDVRWSPTSETTTLLADRNMIEQMVINLSVNARDAMPSGGLLSIETTVEQIDESPEQIDADLAPGLYVILSVTDTGSGMSPETMSHMFEPFFSTKEQGKGTGLGLASVYGVVKQHDGAVAASSQEDVGSTFRVYLPASLGATHSTVFEDDGAATGGAETILFAEDDESVRKLTVAILESAGYHVIPAENGADAFSKFVSEADRLDLVILDVVMPGMTGREVYDRMIQRRPDLKVLFATGYSRREIHVDFVLERGLRLIPKPFDRKTLLRAVRDTLG